MRVRLGPDVRQRRGKDQNEDTPPGLQEGLIGEEFLKEGGDLHKQSEGYNVEPDNS